MSPRNTMALVAMFCVAAVTQLPAQQIADSARVVPAAAPAPVAAVQTDIPSTTVPGPRLTPRLKSVEPTLVRSDASSGLALAPQSGSSTIVISTAGLLIVLLIVLLIL